jgi:hypothetical protein
MERQTTTLRTFLTVVMVLGMAFMAPYVRAQATNKSAANSKPETATGKKVNTEKAILAGGCFWGIP